MNSMKYLVYYRALPQRLMEILTKDGHMSYAKDGVYDLDGHKTPRLSITVHPVNVHADKDRIRKLDQTLNELRENNQIVDWS